MNATTLAMNYATASFPTQRTAPTTGAQSRRTAGPASAASPTLALASIAARELAITERTENAALLVLGGCALGFIVDCALHVERFVAKWQTFEGFVRAMLG